MASLLWFELLPSHSWGVWALIIPALVIYFEQNDHLILLDEVTHVETNIFSFQMALQDVQAMLPQDVHFHVPPFENLVVQSYLSYKLIWWIAYMNRRLLPF